MSMALEITLSRILSSALCFYKVTNVISLKENRDSSTRWASSSWIKGYLSSDKIFANHLDIISSKGI